MIKFMLQDDYYLPPGGSKKNPGGQLYNKINTIKARNKKRKESDEAHLAQQTTGNKKRCELVNPKEQEANNWLKLNADPWSTVIDSWKISFSSREQFLGKPKSVEQLKATFYWKFIRCQYGYQLVSLLFNFLSKTNRRYTRVPTHRPPKTVISNQFSFGICSPATWWRCSCISLRFLSICLQIDIDYLSLTLQAEDVDRSQRWSNTITATISFAENRSLDELGASLIEVLKKIDASEGKVS